MRVGLYIQVPFCQTKCTYCHFHTGVFSESIFPRYVDAVCREISTLHSLYGSENLAPQAGKWSDTVVDTVYVGGGTPSLLEPVALQRIVDELRSHLHCAFEEVTLEADPETVSAAQAAAWKRAGFDRVSLGAQSFEDGELRATGRKHRAADIYSAMSILREAGITHINCDLILGLPNQTHESWERSVNQLFALRPEHASIYMLEVDEGSRLGREVISGGSRYGAPGVVEDDAVAGWFEETCALFSAAGYEHYEISNWALPGCRARHNSKYWRREPYLGLGAGAHSFNGLERWANAHDPVAYAAAIESGLLPVEQRETVTRERALEEEFFLGLRLLEGVNLTRIEKEYGVSLRSRLPRLLEAGAVEFDGATLRLAPARLAVCEEVMAELLT